MSSLHTPYTRDMFGPEKPETKIIRRVIRARELRGMTSEDVARAVNASPLYGTYAPGSLRNLERTDFESDAKPRTTLNVLLVKALASVFGVSVSDLATDDELRALRDEPYRRAQLPISLQRADRANAAKGTPVPSPHMTRKRLTAYMQQGKYPPRDFAELLTKNGYPMTSQRLRDALNPDKPNASRVFTYEFCDAAAKVFRGKGLMSSEFEPEWLIQCRADHCPHCYPILIEV